MSRILVDSSIWIDYFRDKHKYKVLLDHTLILFSADRHFQLMSEVFSFRLFEER